MSTEDEMFCLHEGISVTNGMGGLGLLLGMSSFMMGAEMDSHHRFMSDMADTKAYADRIRKTTARRWRTLGAILSLVGMVTIMMSLLAWRDKKIRQATTVAGLTTQARRKLQEPSVDEAGLIGVIGIGLIIAGLFVGSKNFLKTESYGWVSALLYASGWIVTAFSASMDTKSIDSVSSDRLAWLLPGVVAIVAGTFSLPFFIRRNYVTGPAFPLLAAGIAVFSVGNGMTVSGV